MRMTAFVTAAGGFLEPLRCATIGFDLGHCCDSAFSRRLLSLRYSFNGRVCALSFGVNDHDHLATFQTRVLFHRAVVQQVRFHPF